MLAFLRAKGGEIMLRKVLREIEKLEQTKSKKEEQIKALQNEVNKIEEELKPYYTIKKQYEKLEENAKELISKD